jgi:hypothetical protein
MTWTAFEPMLDSVMEEFEALRGIALGGPRANASLRYARAGRKAASSRARQMSELAAAARQAHRGLFARVNPPRGAEAD